MGVSTKKKILISLFSAVLFIILSLPLVYMFTNNLLFRLMQINTLSDQHCPTLTGVFIHGLVFAILTLITMYI